MNDTVIIGLISTLCTAVATLWTTYVWLQKNKDEAIQKERDRADQLIKEQRDWLQNDYKEEKEFIISHYESMLRVLKERYGIDKNVLEEETKKTDRIDRLSISDMAHISNEMRAKLNEKDKP